MRIDRAGVVGRVFQRAVVFLRVREVFLATLVLESKPDLGFEVNHFRRDKTCLAQFRGRSGRWDCSRTKTWNKSWTKSRNRD